MSAVTKEDVARLHTYLVVPVAVADALSSAQPIEGEDQYAMHVALSEIDSDSALLAIALGAYRIAQEYAGDIPVAAALKYESEKIIQDYAPDWLDNYHNHPVENDALYDLLRNIPEDLESMAELLETLQASIRDEDTPAHTLCAILAIQARAHMEIADYVLSELEADRMAELEEEDMDGVCSFATPTLYAPDHPEGAANGSNIILFPIHRCR